MFLAFSYVIKRQLKRGLNQMTIECQFNIAQVQTFLTRRKIMVVGMNSNLHTLLFNMFCGFKLMMDGSS